jgi:thymidylate synthase (FAD)
VTQRQKYGVLRFFTFGLALGYQMTEIQFRSDVTVELVRSSAQDADVLFAARVSTQGEQTLESAIQSGAEVEKRDKGLINYLMRDRHGSPFEHNSTQ